MTAPVAPSIRPKIRRTGFESDNAEKIHRLIDTYGVTSLAALIGVSKSQPTRWRQGRERPAPPAVKGLLALEYLTSRLSEVFTARQAQIWFDSPNPYLNGSTPAAVFASFGGQAVEPAISAVEVGAAV
jgi:hypothetical protein